MYIYIHKACRYLAWWAQGQSSPQAWRLAFRPLCFHVWRVVVLPVLGFRFASTTSSWTGRETITIMLERSRYLRFSVGLRHRAGRGYACLDMDSGRFQFEAYAKSTCNDKQA